MGLKIISPKNYKVARFLIKEKKKRREKFREKRGKKKCQSIT